MRYLFLIFMLFLISGCGGEGRFHANPIPDDEETTDLDGEAQTDIDDTQVDQIDIDADEPIDDSESIDDIDIDDTEQIDEDDTETDDKDVVIEFDHPIIQQDEDNEEPDEDEVEIPEGCGDGGYNLGEQCDTGDFTEMTCKQFFSDKYNSPDQTAVTSGNIYCRSNCTIDYSECKVNPNFKILTDNKNGSYLIYMGMDDKGLPLKKARSHDPELEMRSYKCMPIWDDYKLRMQPMGYTIFRRFLNLNYPLGQKINNQCILKSMTTYPDNVDLTYWEGERDGFDFREDCTDMDELNNPNGNIFMHSLSKDTIIILNHYMKYRVKYPEDNYIQGYLSARANLGISTESYPTILSQSGAPSGYTVLCYDIVSQPTSY